MFENQDAIMGNHGDGPLRVEGRQLLISGLNQVQLSAISSDRIVSQRVGVRGGEAPSKFCHSRTIKNVKKPPAHRYFNEHSSFTHRCRNAKI